MQTDNRPALMRNAAIAFFAVFLVLLPWGIRNAASLGHFVLTRTNLNLELWLSYHAGASAEMESNAGRWHPFNNMSEALAVKTLGEVEYNRRKLPEVVAWVKQDPLRILRLTGEHVWLYWFHRHKSRLHTLLDGLFMIPVIAGFPLVWKRSRRFGLHALALLAIYPLIYYVLQASPRYRMPIEWLLVMSAGTAVGAALLYVQSKLGLSKQEFPEGLMDASPEHLTRGKVF
jgi:hypothetical protein